MSEYSLPPGEKNVPPPTPEMIAASAFVAAADGGGPMNEHDIRVLRDALYRLLAGQKPGTVFKNQPARGVPNKASRNLIVAVYVESRRRFYEQPGRPSPLRGQGRTPLERAKRDAAEAFNWSDHGVTAPESAIQDAWTQCETTVRAYSPQVIKRALAHQKNSGK